MPRPVPSSLNNTKGFAANKGEWVKAPNNNENLNLYIYSTTGILMYQSKLNALIGQQVVVVNNWTNGIYGYSVHGSADKIGSGTFAVSR